jgi:hypothetical protein
MEHLLFPRIDEKHLWEYGNRHLFEVQLNHRAEIPFKSWQQFIESKILNCNCLSGGYLLHWYWDAPESPDGKELEITDDRLNLIYTEWFSSLTRFEIMVSKFDEPQIREYIRQAQSINAV